MLNISRILDNPKFKQPNGFIVVRSQGDWVNGKFVNIPSQIQFSGVIVPNGGRKITQTPDGDTTTDFLTAYTKQGPLYVSRWSSIPINSGLSDEIIYKGENYKITVVQDYSDFGFWEATAVRKISA